MSLISQQFFVERWKKWLFWFFERWLVSRKKPNVPFAGRLSFYTDAQRAAYWRWAGFLALNFNRRTEVEFCTSVDTKPFSPPIANTMLYDVVMFWVLVQLNIFVCHFLIYPGICTLIFLTIQFLFLKLNQSLKIEQSNFPLYRSLKMFVLF